MPAVTESVLRRCVQDIDSPVLEFSQKAWRHFCRLGWCSVDASGVESLCEDLSR